MKMILKAAVTVAAITLLAGCATTHDQHNLTSTPQTSPSLSSSEQAKVYMAELQKKRQRFIEKQLLANAAAYADPEVLAADASAARSECAGIAKSEWAASVRYGQNFLGYSTHVDAIQRCLKVEKQAG